EEEPDEEGEPGRMHERGGERPRAPVGGEEQPADGGEDEGGRGLQGDAVPQVPGERPGGGADDQEEGGGEKRRREERVVGAAEGERPAAEGRVAALEPPQESRLPQAEAGRDHRERARHAAESRAPAERRERRLEVGLEGGEEDHEEDGGEDGGKQRS